MDKNQFIDSKIELLFICTSLKQKFYWKFMKQKNKINFLALQINYNRKTFNHIY
jgi:hypothetical protein